MASNPISFQEYASRQAAINGDSDFYAQNSPDSFLGKVRNFFDGKGDQLKQGYENYLNNYWRMTDYELSKEAEAEARAFDEKMSNTAFQRAYADLVKTGLNPRLLLQQNMSASSPTGTAAYSFSGSSSRSSSESTSKSESFSKSAILVALVAAIVKFLV